MNVCVKCAIYSRWGVYICQIDKFTPISLWCFDQHSCRCLDESSGKKRAKKTKQINKRAAKSLMIGCEDVTLSLFIENSKIF